MKVLNCSRQYPRKLIYNTIGVKLFFFPLWLWKVADELVIILSKRLEEITLESVAPGLN